MRRFNALARTVPLAIATGEIGSPVAVRIIAHLAADHGLLERLAARCLAEASSWLQSAPSTLQALGGSAHGQISLLAAFERGQSALVSVGACGVGQPRLECVVWGNRGVLSWEEGDDWLDVEDRDTEPPLNEEAGKQLASLRDALHASASSAAPQQSRQTRAAWTSPRLPKPLAPPYGVLLVSGDHTHQSNYAEALAADGRCRLIGLTDEANVTPQRSKLNERLARRLNIPLLPDLAQALHRDDVQIVSICAEPMRRGRIIVQAAQAGKHLYLDKPLAGSVGDARRIVTAVEQAGVTAHMFSLAPLEPAQRLQRVIQSGELGTLTALHFDLCFAKGDPGTARLGQTRRETPEPTEYELPDAKREMTNVGVYPLVALLWTVGRKVRRVAATTGNYFFQEHQARDMEDFGQMLLELDDGAVATVSAGRAGWRSHPSSGLNRTCVIGSKRIALFDAHRPRIAVWADVPGWAPPQRDPDDPMSMWGHPKKPQHTAQPKQAWITPPALGPAADAKYFLDCLQAGRASEINAALAAHTTEILLAAYRSAANGSAMTALA
jgi:predicted dehydrogenase